MMLCDELQYERLGDANETYPASTLVIRKQFVVAAIDELKREHHRERHEYIDMVAQHKAKIVEQESENRKLKRALWLARAERAMAESYSVLNDVSTSNRWVKALNKLKAKADEFKESK